MSRLASVSALLLLCALPACAQTGTAPALTVQPNAPYPEAARKADVSGEAVVGFSIDPTGKTIGVHAVSGPELLTGALQDEIRRWRFVTPLPRDAEKDFVADYTFSIVDPSEHVGDSGSKPPPNDADVLPGPIAAVSGVVRSANNRQTIDATPYVKNDTKPAAAATAQPH